MNNTGGHNPGQLTSESISRSMDESALISAVDVVAKTDGNSFWIDQVLEFVPIHPVNDATNHDQTPVVNCNLAVDLYCEICNVVTTYLRVIFDSGCTNHMLPTNHSMFNYVKCRGGVKLGNQDMRLGIVGRGDTKLLTDVLHVPGLSFGLISIGQLDDMEFFILFARGQVHVLDSDGTLILHGYKDGNLCLFR